jgi:hypothetical protein
MYRAPTLASPRPSMVGRASASASCPARCIVLLFAFAFLLCLLRCAAESCILRSACIECYLANVAGHARQFDLATVLQWFLAGFMKSSGRRGRQELAL